MYKIRESKEGYAIFFVEKEKDEFIVGKLSQAEAFIWFARLNDAFLNGYKKALST